MARFLWNFNRSLNFVAMMLHYKICSMITWHVELMALNYREKIASRARALHNSTKHQRSIVTQGFPCEELKQQEWYMQPFYHCKRQHNKTTFKFKETKCHAYIQNTNKNNHHHRRHKSQHVFQTDMYIHMKSTASR